MVRVLPWRHRTTTALTSMCVTEGFSSSLRKPVIRFTTPPGRSLVASTSVKVTAGKRLAFAGHHHAGVAAGDHRCDHAHQFREAGCFRAIMPTTPVGSYTLKLKCELLVGFTLLKTAWYLSHQPA
jgi:hypothetical protein